MSKKIVLMFGCLLVSGCVFAAASIDSAPQQQQNPHRERDIKMRLCKAEADQKQLVGDERRVYIASCMQKNT